MVVALPGHNFAKAHGIDSVAGAVVFAALYVTLLWMFIKRAISRPTFVYKAIALFSALRIIAFVLRAHLAGLDGGNLNMLVAFDIIYNVGFFALVCSTYTLVLDRGRLSDLPLSNSPISRMARSALLFRIALFLAVLIDVTGVIHSVTSSTEGTTHFGHILRKVSIYVFLVLCILVAIQIVLLARTASTHGTYKASNGGFGATHGIRILCVIALLLLAREAFFVATSGDRAKRDDENLWYPFAALTEFIAALMFVSPGLVPSSDELPS